MPGLSYRSGGIEIEIHLIHAGFKPLLGLTAVRGKLDLIGDVDERLDLSEDTVRKNTSAIFARLNVSDRTQAVVIAPRQRLVNLS